MISGEPDPRAGRTIVRTRVARIAVAVALLVAATVLRELLDPILGDQLPYVTYFTALFAVAALTSTPIAIGALVAAWLLSEYFFVEPRLAILWFERGAVVRTLSFFAAGAIAIALADRMRAAWRHADALASSLEEENRAVEILRAVGARCARPDCGTIEGLEAILEAALSLSLAPRGAVHVIDATTGHLVVAAERGSGPPVHEVKTALMSSAGTQIGMLSTGWTEVHQPASSTLRRLDLLARQAADFVERKNAESALQQGEARERSARQAAERALRIKDDFLGTLSHELRTPLNAILGWTQLLKKDVGTESERVRQAVEVIDRNGRAQAKLVADMLDLSRLVSGRVQLDLRDVDLAEVARSAADGLRRTADDKGVELQVVAFPRTMVRGDSARLQQVASNLLANAIKFTPAKGAVRMTVEPAKGPWAEMRVTDTGEGIPTGFLPLIFDRFSQADASASRRHGGLGIGLSIVKDFVELHGGSVRAESAGPGTGATFVVLLPASALRTDSPRQSDERGAAPSLAGLNLLVVEDDPDARELVREILEERGAGVTIAESAFAGLARLQDGVPDVLVTDIGMPGLDGYDFLAEVRRQGILAPAVAVTAFAHPSDRHRALSSGFLAHLSKPIDPRDLVTTIAAVALPASKPKG